jgi:hypothetical protein
MMLDLERTSETAFYFNETRWRCIPESCHLDATVISLLRHALLTAAQQLTFSMLTRVSAWTQVLLLCARCLYVQSFCATDVSSDLATGVAVTRVLRGRLEESIITGTDYF